MITRHQTGLAKVSLESIGREVRGGHEVIAIADTLRKCPGPALLHAADRIIEMATKLKATVEAEHERDQTGGTTRG